MIKRNFKKMKRKIVHMKDFLSHQFNGDRFYRYDLMVRYSFIRNFYEQKCYDNFRDPLYEQFYKHKRINYRTTKFIDIIKSFEKEGFSEKYKPYMIMNKEYKMCGGNHRIACCLWFKIDKFPIYIPKRFYDVCKIKKRCWNKKWLISHGLEKNIPYLEKIKQDIFRRLGV